MEAHTAWYYSLLPETEEDRQELHLKPALLHTTLCNKFWFVSCHGKKKHVYLVEIATQNIQLAFKLRDWLWLKKKIDYIAEWKQDTTVSLNELREAPFRLSLALNFQSIPPHHVTVIG